MEYLEQIITWGGAGLAAAIGALTSIIGLVVSIKKAAVTLKDTSSDYDAKAAKLAELSEETANMAVALSASVKTITDAYEKQDQTLTSVVAHNDETRVELAAAYERLKLEYDSIKEALILIAANTPALVANGAAKRIETLLQSNANDKVKVVVDE